MKLFADTASVEEIEYCFLHGVNDGITTNPKIMEASGDLSNGFEFACNSILKRFPEIPVSLETDLRGLTIDEIHDKPDLVKQTLLAQAYSLSKLSANVIVKIPVCEGGLLAAKVLAEKGIRTNITACMTPYQALKASEYGIGYVSLFANRMVDSHIIELAGYSLEDTLKSSEWKEIVKNNTEKYLDAAWDLTLSEIAYVSEQLDKDGRCHLIIGSIRSPEDLYKLSKSNPHIITVPYNIVKSLSEVDKLKNATRVISASNISITESLYHPMTQLTLVEFEKAADSYRLKKV
jgi:transaldolase